MLNRVHYLLVAALVGCASGSSQEGQAPNPGSNVLTRAQLEEAGVRNAYEAVERLRPRWLTVLERIGIDGIYEIRYLDGATASASLPGLGGRHVDGAIIIYMSPPE